MKKSEHINYWLQMAEHDLDVAQSLFETRKYDWCLYISHLVLEKTLKANYVQTNDNKIPPKTHNLVKLAELSFINLKDENKLFLDEVNDFNLEARYPDYKLKFYKICTKEFTENKFKSIKKYYQWLKSLIK